MQPQNMHMKHNCLTVEIPKPKDGLFIILIYDMIKGNESDVGNIDFELQAKRVDKFLCFPLFLKLKNHSYLWNQMFD